MKKTLNSLTVIKNYYSKRRDKLDSETAQKLASHLLWFSKLNTRRDLLRDAIDILESNFDRGKANTNGKEYFFQVKSFEPGKFERKLIETILNNNYSDWCSLFKGAYNISVEDIINKDLKEKICRTCFNRDLSKSR